MGILGQPGFGDKLEVGNFVVLSNVESASNLILKKMETQMSVVDRIVSRTEFLRRFANVLNPSAPLSQNDLTILLVHLARDKQAISYDAQTIKFKSENESSPLPITQEDTAIANLRDTLAKINAQIPVLTSKVAETEAAAREAVQKKQMVTAKAALRSKKLAESALAQRTDVALQLEGVYAQVQQAADQVEIVEAMKAGATALKGLNQKVGGAEGVSAVVDSLNEEMATADEINNIINESGQPVDEMEIDDEFEALENAEKAEKEKREQEEEAAKTAARLAELEELEKERKEKEKENEPLKELAKQSPEEKEIEQASQSFSRMSFEEDTDKKDKEDRTGMVTAE